MHGKPEYAGTMTLHDVSCTECMYMHSRLSLRIVFQDLAFFSARENITYFGSVLRLRKMKREIIGYFSESHVSKPHSHLSHPPYDATSRALLATTTTPQRPSPDATGSLQCGWLGIRG